MPILGLHHVTATVDSAQADLDFAAGALGLRLVKKTVNFDNHHVYHFYYGNAVGEPGTLWTTFPYHGRGVRVGTKGRGQVTATSFSVPATAVDFWIARCAELGLGAVAGATRFGEPVVTITDPSGLTIELIGGVRDPRDPWATDAVSATNAIRGLHSVSLTVGEPAPTTKFMATLLGFELVGVEGDRTRLAVGGDASGRIIDVVAAPQAPSAVNGLGTVHHVAMAVATPEEQLSIKHEVERVGISVTPVMDRQYFQSIYFREPGGVLFEVATIGPGFLIDEPRDELASSLKLPPWEEPHRAAIEAGLAAVVVPT